MTTVLTGGTGGCKLLDGLRKIWRIREFELHAVVNTGDDVEISGNLVCPDLDSVLYTLSGLIDKETWFGIEDDTYETHEALHEPDAPHIKSGSHYLPPDRQTQGRALARNRRFSGVGEFMSIGDRDRATHIKRTALIDGGASLTGAMSQLGQWFDLDSHILPMSDDPVSSMIHTTEEGDMHFQEFWIRQNGEPTVEDIRFAGLEQARPTGAVMNALAQPVLIAPSNPVTSIGPILNLTGVRKALEDTTVVAVSPFLEDETFSGPASQFMEAKGYEPGTSGMLEVYGDILDGVVLHDDDSTYTSLPVVRTDTTMNDGTDRRRVAQECLRFLYRLI